MPRSASLRTLAAVGERGQASRNACGVRPVHRRNDRWNAAGSEYWRKNAMSPMLRLRSCNKAHPNSRRTSSRMLRNDAPSSARRRLRVRRLTASALATVAGVGVVSPRCSTIMCRTRPLSAPEPCRSRSANALSSRRRTIKDRASSAACRGRAASTALKIIEFEPALKRTGLRKNRRCSDASSGAVCAKHTWSGEMSAPCSHARISVPPPAQTLRAPDAAPCARYRGPGAGDPHHGSPSARPRDR